MLRSIQNRPPSTSEEIHMKTAITLFFLLIPVTILAQNYGNMNKGDMQNMMQVMQQVQECMANIDQTKLNELKTRSEQAKQEIDTLCGQGKRDKAQNRAIAFGREITSDPTMQQMRTCSEMVQGAIPMPDMADIYNEKDYTQKHVCD